MRHTSLATTCAVLFLTATDADAARGTLQQARYCEVTGDYHAAYKLYCEVADGCRNDDLDKRFRSKADALARAAEDTIRSVKTVADAKGKDQSAVVQALRDCWPIVLGWRDHKYGNAANACFGKLKKRLKSETKREAEEEAKSLAKAAYEAIKAERYEEALRTYQQLYEQYPFTKEASKRLRTYVDLREKVRLPPEDVRDMSRETRKRNRRRRKRGEE